MNQFIFNLFYLNEELKKLLTKDGVTKVYSAGLAPLNVTSPYVTWQRISNVPTNTIGNKRVNERSRVQFDIYSNDERQVLEIQKLLNDQITRVGFILSSAGPTRENETKHYRIIQDVNFITSGA